MIKYLAKSTIVLSVRFTVFCFGIGLCSPFQQEFEMWNRTALASVIKMKLYVKLIYKAANAGTVFWIIDQRNIFK